MGIELITLAIIVALFTLMAIGVLLGASTMLISVTTAYFAFGSNGFVLVTSAVTKVMDKHALIAVPFFVFMANSMERSGIAREMFKSMAILGGQMRGGVAVQTCLVSLILAAMSGIVGGEIVRDEHSDLHAVTALWPGLFLSEIRGAKRCHPAGDILGGLALHPAADYRPCTGHGFSANRSFSARALIEVIAMDLRDEEPKFKVYEFGWWPEIVGAAAVVLSLWYLITYARGSL